MTILEVQDTFSRMASLSGPGSTTTKRRVLESLLGRASPEEGDVLLRTLFGEMRHGVVEGVMLDAIADASDADVQDVRRANMLLGDIGEVGRIALTEGASGLARVGLRLFTPIKPMLAEMADGLEEAIAEHGGKTALEYKLDGARIQIHKEGDRVRIFSRRLTDVTQSLPDIVEAAGRLEADSALVEGEVVAVDSKGRPLPFQDLMRRFRRVHAVEEQAERIPLELYLFDVPYLNGEILLEAPYESRWAALEGVAPEEHLTPRLVTGRSDEAAAFLEAAIEAGHEGLMAKALDSPYTPGKRGKRWLKIKPVETLDCVIVAAEWGSGRREGWLSNYHLAVYDAEADDYAMIGKTFKGLTDREFTDVTARLRELQTEEIRWGIRVRPEIVVEVAYNEIQRSPHYESGYALRFARITRFREDKGPREADTIERLEALYQKQFERKGRLRDEG
jgi:DNA ligase-1